MSETHFCILCSHCIWSACCMPCVCRKAKLAYCVNMQYMLSNEMRWCGVRKGKSDCLQTVRYVARHGVPCGMGGYCGAKERGQLGGILEKLRS